MSHSSRTLFTPTVVAGIVDATGSPLAMTNEEEQDPIGLLAFMLKGNLQTFVDLRDRRRAPTPAELRGYFGRVEKAAVGLIAALGMSSTWDELKGDKWAWMRLIHQTWAPEWQRIANPPDMEQQHEINEPLFRLLRAARRQQALVSKSGTKKVDHLHRWLVADLAGIFECAFQQRATATNNGRFVKFADAVLIEVDRHLVARIDLSRGAIRDIFRANKSRARRGK